MTFKIKNDQEALKKVLAYFNRKRKKKELVRNKINIKKMVKIKQIVDL